MNKKALKWLYQELPDLITRGILTQEAAVKIKEYYGEIKSTGKRSIAFIICGAAGALLIGLGIILLFAYNWEQFSRFTRTILSFLPLVVGQEIALWVLWKRPDSSAWKEGSAIFLSLMVGSSIALISQTYNITGSPETFTLTWMFLILPLVYLMQASLPAIIYLIGITVWAGCKWDDLSHAILFWPFAALIVPHFIWSLRKEIYTLRSTMMSLVMAICVSCATGFTLGRSWPDAWIIIFPSLYTILYYLGTQEFNGLTSNWQKPLRLISGIGIFLLAFEYTFRYFWQFFTHKNPLYDPLEGQLGLNNALPCQLITLALVAMSVLFFYETLRRKDLSASLILGVPILSILAYIVRDTSVVIPLLIFNVYMFALGIVRIMQGVRYNNPKMINTGMLILAVLIIARFFDSDVSFVVKGLAFIIVGSGFLTVNLFLSRQKEVQHEK